MNGHKNNIDLRELNMLFLYKLVTLFKCVILNLLCTLFKNLHIKLAECRLVSYKTVARRQVLRVISMKLKSFFIYPRYSNAIFSKKKKQIGGNTLTAFRCCCHILYIFFKRCFVSEFLQGNFVKLHYYMHIGLKKS